MVSALSSPEKWMGSFATTLVKILGFSLITGKRSVSLAQGRKEK